MNSRCGLLVNSSRGIIYAGKGADFGTEARKEAKKLQGEMEVLLNQYCY
jgi:orotidine-5'-phosphate decarboxylase